MPRLNFLGPHILQAREALTAPRGCVFLCPFVCVVDGLAVRFAPYSQAGFSQTSRNQRIPSFFHFEFVFL